MMMLRVDFNVNNDYIMNLLERVLRLSALTMGNMRILCNPKMISMISSCIEESECLLSQSKVSESVRSLIICKKINYSMVAVIIYYH